MSLHIYFEGMDALPDMPIERDVEALFMRVRLDGSEYDKAILEELEKGQYVDNLHFIDRFGRTLSRDCLSTGTKAALSLYHMPDVMVWGVSIGCNAVTEIVKYCTRGMLLLPADGCCIFSEIEDVTIDVICKGRHYTSLDAFAERMMENEWEEETYD